MTLHTRVFTSDYSGIFHAERTVKRVNVQVPDETHTRAKVIAVLTNRTLSEYFEQAIRDAVQRDKHILDKIKK